uniref:Methyltransferase-like protein 5 n=1 Tax=Plectus sambesii TaxID=2011161 RepID=A0A914V2M3_9BILA
MKRKELEWILGDLDSFKNPKVLLEQYATGPEIAATIMQTIDSEHDGIDGKAVADLGSGCGPLLISAALLGAQYCVGFEIDEDALATCSDNLKTAEADCCVDLVHCNVLNYLNSPRWKDSFDTVLINPPFGTKHNRGMDIRFLETGLQMASNAVYSLHKTSTRDYVLNRAKELNAKATVLAELRYDLPATYKHHKKQSVDIEVDFIKFVRNKVRE